MNYEYVCTKCGVVLQPNDQTVACLEGVIRKDNRRPNVPTSAIRYEVVR